MNLLLFRKGFCVQESKRDLTKVLSFVKNGSKSTRSSCLNVNNYWSDCKYVHVICVHALMLATVAQIHVGLVIMGCEFRYPQDPATHYEDMPVQIYWKFYHQKKMKFFRWKIPIFFKNSDIFHISARNTDCGYRLNHLDEAVLRSTHNLYFWAEIRKIMYG